MDEKYKDLHDSIITMLCDLAFGGYSDVNDRLIRLWYETNYKGIVSDLVEKNYVTNLQQR